MTATILILALVAMFAAMWLVGVMADAAAREQEMRRNHRKPRPHQLTPDDVQRLRDAGFEVMTPEPFDELAPLEPSQDNKPVISEIIKP